MDLKGINLHIENFVPGMIISAEVSLLVNPGTFISAFLGETEKTMVFIAASYMLGVLSATLSRLIVDAISESGPRALIFSLLAHHRLADLKKSLKNIDTRFNGDLLSKKKHEIFNAHEWNSVYRAILRSTLSQAGDKAKEEIYRRRENARLVRNFFTPTLLGAFIYSQTSHNYLPLVFGAVIGITLYAYAELNIFSEAADIYWTHSAPEATLASPKAKPSEPNK